MGSKGFIKIDDSQVRELEGLLSGVLPRELKRAKRTALNRTRRGTQQRLGTLIRERGEVKYNIPARRAKQGVTLTPIRNSAFFVFGSNRPLSLTSFTGTRQLKRAGLSIAIRKGERVRISSGFIRIVHVKAKDGSTTPVKQAFRREFIGGKQVGRYSIKRLVGPSIANMMNRNNAEADLADFLQDRFDRELAGAIRAALLRRK